MQSFKHFFVEQQNFQGDLKDFIDEFVWYQKEAGIGTNISPEQIKERFLTAKVVPVNPSFFDTLSNSYTKMINGRDVNERFKQYLDHYLKEKREAGTERAYNDKDKEAYLKGLIKAVQNKAVHPPMVLDVEEVGKILIGGRTRAAAAKTINVPINTKIISIGKEEILDINKAQQIYKTISIN